jgi:hypothetical protein
MIVTKKNKVKNLCGLLETDCVNKYKSILLSFLDFILNNITCHEMYSFMDGYIRRKTHVFY